jgi:hypothetical protein
MSDTMKTISQSRFSSPDCQEDLAALDVTTNQIKQYASQASIQEGPHFSANYASAIWGNSYNANKARYGNETVAGFFGSHPGTVAVAQALGHSIYIDSRAVGTMSTAALYGMGVHELVHNITGNVDTVLQQQLNTVLPNGQKLTVGARRKISEISWQKIASGLSKCVPQ